MELLKHQNEALEFLSTRRSAGLFYEMRLGKTVIMLEHLKRKSVNNKMFPCLIVAPLSGVSIWQREAHKFGFDFKFQELVGEFHDRVSKLNSPADIYVVNYEGMRILEAHLVLKKWGTIILDECFEGNTLVKTPDGYRKISEIKVGDTVCNAIGTGDVKSVFKKCSNKILEIKTSKETIVCTTDHPFFTNHGWVLACNLSEKHCIKNYEKTMRMVQKGLRHERVEKNESVLREILLGEVEDESSILRAKSFLCGNEKEDVGVNKTSASKRSISCKELFKENDKEQSNENGWCEREGFRYIEKDLPQADYKRWKRDRAYQSGIYHFGENEKSCLELSSIIGKARKWLSELLQNRLGIHSFKNWNRSGRIQPQMSCETGARQKEGSETEGAWVVSVKSIERESFQRYGGSIEGITVYNLEVSGHPSYIVTKSDLVVHNCHRCKSIKSKQTHVAIKLCEQSPHKYLLTGTPITKSPEDLYTQMNCISPGCIGNYWAFAARYIEYKKVRIRISKGYREIRKPCRFKNLDELKQRIIPYAIRRTQKECIDLPEASYQVLSFEMTPEQKKHYLMLKKCLTTTLNEKQFIVTHAATLIQKLQQVCSGFIYDENENTTTFESGKRKVLFDLLHDILDNSNEKVILFTWFRADIEILKKMLSVDHKVFVYDGSSGERKAIEEGFQNHEGPAIFLSNVERAKEAIRLDTANTVIYFGNSWSHATRIQSEARAQAMGKKANIIYYDIICPGTVDEIVHDTLKYKGDIADKTLGDTKRLAEMICQKGDL